VTDSFAPRPQSLRTLIQYAAEQLLAVRGAEDLDEARLEVELFYGRAANLDRVHVIAAGGDPADPAASKVFEQLLIRRLAHEPLAYILGQREFYGLMFEVGPGALIPRPETETLVEAALEVIREHPRHQGLVRVADIGTGSGAIAISVARHAPAAKMFAVDQSTEALQWAGKNRTRLGPIDRVILLTGDMLEPLTEPLDIVLANLPYVPTEEYKALPDEIRTHEPELAVDGGDDGLDLYRRFAVQLPAHLVDDTYAVLIEIGAGQAPFAEDILLEALGRPKNATVTAHRDLRGIRRIIEVRVGY
jgi:release factor glutamine methyltransferase